MALPKRGFPAQDEPVSPPKQGLIAPEICRQVYLSLDLDPESRPIIGITSAVAGEGRTTLAISLARTLADDMDDSVLLVEADLEHPSMASSFGLAPEPGL